ncbi:Metallo-dependent phosphatase-like protein, partial [Globomyces pollinis-pini]
MLQYTLLFTFAANVLASPAVSDASILILGDWGSSPDIKSLKQVAKAMDRVAIDTSAYAVFTVGDNFYDDGVDSVNDKKWDDLWSNVFTGATSKVKWNVIMGNHDWYGTPRAQLEYAKINSRWHQPDFFYDEEIQVGKSNIGFVFIETDLLAYGYGGKDNKPQVRKNFVKEGWVDGSSEIENQLEWIETTLKKYDGYDYLFVFGHHNLQTCKLDSDDMDTLDRLLKKYNVSAYVHGHKHALQSYKSNSMLYIQSGSAGVLEDVCKKNKGWGAAEHGFVNLRIKESSFKFDFYNMDGDILHTEN